LSRNRKSYVDDEYYGKRLHEDKSLFLDTIEFSPEDFNKSTVLKLNLSPELCDMIKHGDTLTLKWGNFEKTDTV